MDQYLAQFLDTLVAKKGYSENTISAYRNDIRQFAKYVREHQGQVAEPGEVGAQVVEAYAESLRNSPDGYAPSTIARKIAAVKSFFNFLVEQKAVTTNPTAHLSSPKIKKQAPRTLTPEQMEQLLEAPTRAGGPKGLRDRALLEILCATGLRVTEVVNLGLEDIDWENGLIICRGKGERQRRIPLGAASAILADYMQNARATLARPNSPPVVFLNHRGHKLTRQGVWLILKDAADAAGVGQHVTPHTLRHSFARYLVARGEDLRRVQELLGHANLSTTQVYRHVTPEDSPEAKEHA